METTSLANGTYFDHAADGFAERTGWVGKDDGLLVRDLNGNGLIDSGRELFGSETLLANGQKAANGFEALRELDSNHDGVIDANDPAFAELRVWKDANGNGLTDEGELLTLEQAGVRNINLIYANVNQVDAQGNIHKQTGSYTTTDGQTRKADDVWFAADPANTITTEWVDVSDDIAALPDARGFGKVRDLHQAMTMDATGQLKALVTAFTQAETVADRMMLVRQIIYRWAGVQDVNPTSRINSAWNNVLGDGRKIEALEEFLGEEWVQGNSYWGSNPGPDASRILNEAYGQLEALVYGQLMAGSHLKDLFEQMTYYWDEESEDIQIDLSQIANTIAAQIETDRGAGLDMLGDFLVSLNVTGLFDRIDINVFKSTLLPLGTDVAQTFNMIPADWIANVFHGTEGNDVLYGTKRDDQLFGYGGNDILIGGGGDDVLKGGYGSDIYLFGRGDGHDTIIENPSRAGDTDRIGLKAGITPDDVRLKRVNSGGYDLKLTILDTGETITVQSQFDGNGYGVEEIVFADGTVWDLEAIKSRVLLSTDGDDTLYGFADDDILDGGAGDDVLYGGAGSDTYLFGRGDGHDTIIENSWSQSDTDRIELKAGISPNEVRLERVRNFINGWQPSDDLVLTIRNTGETITVQNQFIGYGYGVEEIVFADGTVWDLEVIKSRVLLSTDGDDTLYGFAGDDILDGGAGDDVLEGGDGSDTYRFGLGDGQDVIIEGETSGEDVLELGAGITPADVTVRWTMQGDMAVTLADGSRVIVRNQAYPWSNLQGIEQLRFADGTVWDRSELAARALTGTDGNDTIVGGYQNDTLDGGPGNDNFQDLGGYDTYLFGIGDGQDTITDISGGHIQFKPGIDQNEMTFTRDGNDLIATIAASGDAVRIMNWLNQSSWSRIDRFDFANDASLSINDVLDKLNVEEGAEILYGSPGDDILIGSEKDSTIYGREGNDILIGGDGNDTLYGEAGDDDLDGGAGRDWLDGGTGRNIYRMTQGMGLDTANGDSLAVAEDTVVFAPGIRPEDITVQLGDASWNEQPGDTGYSNLIIGIGGDDALIVRSKNWQDLSQSAIQHFRFADGTKWTLADVIARADGGKLGWQQRQVDDPTTIIGSAGDDSIYDTTGQSITVQARGNDDYIQLGAGNDLISAGSGNDTIYSGGGDDLIAGEAGDDTINAGDGDDVIVFNYGDGNDFLIAGDGTDTLSFGATVTPDMLSVALNDDGYIVLSIDGGTITLNNTTANNLPGDLERIQFIDAEGKARIFDLSGWLQNNRIALLGATAATPLAFDGTAFELTGTVAPAGGLEAVAYAQFGDLFATPYLPNNTPTNSDDVLYGTPEGDTLNAGAGNDIVLGLAGNDIIYGGEGDDILDGGDGDDILDGGPGNDVIYGGRGADTLTGGGGRDQLYGGWGGDTYLFQPGNGEVIIDDDHNVIDWGMGVEMGYRDTIVDEAPNILSFGSGIRPEDLRYSEQNGDLVITFANQPGDRVILRGFELNRATQTRSVDIIRFADGTEIVADTIEITGITKTAGDEGAWLSGTPFADTLIGGAGDDWLAGGGGSDRLAGGAGSDTYFITKKEDSPVSETQIAEIWRPQDTNRIELAGAVNVDDLRLAFDGRDLLLRYTPEGDTIRFVGFDPHDPNMPAPVQVISLPWEGVSLSFDDLLARGVDYGGDPGTGGYVISQIVGTEGDDILTGKNNGYNEFHDGAGNDILIGGNQVDGYFFESGDGVDTIIDGPSDNFIVFGPGIGKSDLTVNWDGDTLVLQYGLGDEIRIPDYIAKTSDGTPPVTAIRFDDGDMVSIPSLIGDSETVQWNTGELPAATEDAMYRYTIPLANFDQDGPFGKARLLNLRQADGSALPGWLMFDAERGVLLGMPTNDDVGQLELSVEIWGDYGLLATQQVSLLVNNTNDAPEIGTLLSDQQARKDSVFTYTLPVNSFYDVDVGDVLIYSATLDNGDPLPGWLAFDAATQTFSGTPTNSDVGNLRLRVTATDLIGVSANQTFWLEVTSDDGGGPDEPQAPITALDTADVFEDGQTITTGNVLTNDYDPSGGVLQVANPGTRTGEYGVLTLLPDGSYTYELDNASAKVQGLGAGETAAERFGYLAGNGVTQSDGELTVTIHGANDAPEITHALDNVDLIKGQPFSWQIPEGSFTDRDVNDTLTYTATLSNGKALPAWLTFDAGTQTFSVTLPANLTSTTQVCVTASDGQGASVSNMFKISINNGKQNGNEGVGNGEDPPPPGHTTNQNDGPGSAPGQPGNQGKNGNSGNMLVGGIGDDTYLFGRSYGQDTIIDYDTTAGNTDTARFLDNITFDQLWFGQAGNDLEVSIIGTTDTLTIRDWYSGAANHVERFETVADSKVLVDTQVNVLVSAMASFNPPPSGQTTLPPDYQTALAPVLAANWK